MAAPTPRDGIPINILLWRTFTPAILIVAIALGALVYNRLYATILDGFDRKLVATSALTGALIDPADHDRLMAAVSPRLDAEALEKSSPFLRNVLPMRRIKRELGLTYLYSQVIGGSKDIFYVMDASEGDDHSPIGSEDDMTPETLAGLKAARSDGTIYISPIEFQEQWGLLKTAAGADAGRDGKITATAGADVNISVIQVATQNALFASALIGVGSLLVCALVTLLIMRRVAQPIAQLKADALRIAAGDRTPPSNLPAPREAVRVREALGQLADKLVASMRGARSETVAHDQARNLQLLESACSSEAGSPVVTLTDTPRSLAVWIGEGDDAATLLGRRAMRLLGERAAADPKLAAEAVELADRGGAVLLFDRTAACVRVAGDTAVNLRVAGAETRLSPGETLSLPRKAPLGLLTGAGEVPLVWEARVIGADVIQRLFALRAIEPFGRLEDVELLLIAQHARQRSFAAGKPVVAAGSVADALFVTLNGGVEVAGEPGPAVFDAAGLLFGLGARADHVAGPQGLSALVIAKPHVFTIARECPEFVVGLRNLAGVA